MSRTVEDMMRRLRGTVWSADEAEQMMDALQERVRDSEQRQMELGVRRAIQGYATRAGNLTDEQFARLSAILMSHLEDNAPVRHRMVMSAMRATAAGKRPKVSEPDGRFTGMETLRATAELLPNVYAGLPLPNGEDSVYGGRVIHTPNPFLPGGSNIRPR